VGVWLSGLDAAAADALAMPGYYASPPVVCYLDRGMGAAIRRARTRLPGGGPSPISIIRIPRERMVGSGIASSLVHEVGHQAAALLGLADSLRPVLKHLRDGPAGEAWACWERWISEILADFWSVARVGVAATMGLMAVVSLPRPFVFRLSLDDPHPLPWIRVPLSSAMGEALYPHPQWRQLRRLWDSFYPAQGLDAGRAELMRKLLAGIPALVSLIVHHRPKALRGAALAEAIERYPRQPARLAARYASWRRAPALMKETPPTLALAVIGQALADGVLGPEAESALVAKLLRHWALRRTFGDSARSGPAPARALAA